MRGIHLVALVGVIGLAGATALPAAAQPEGKGTAIHCKTSKREIASDLRRQDKAPVVRGMRVRDVTACRRKWAVVTRATMGDAAFNARYSRGKWRFYAGYPMGVCGRAPSWLCPTHP